MNVARAEHDAAQDKSAVTLPAHTAVTTPRVLPA